MVLGLMMMWAEVVLYLAIMPIERSVVAMLAMLAVLFGVAAVAMLAVLAVLMVMSFAAVTMRRW